MVDLKGLGTEGAIINLVLSGFIVWHIYVKPKIMSKPGKDRRRNNPNANPGNAPVCKENRDKLIKLETKMEAVEKALNRGKSNVR